MSLQIVAHNWLVRQLKNKSRAKILAVLLIQDQT